MDKCRQQGRAAVWAARTDRPSALTGRAPLRVVLAVLLLGQARVACALKLISSNDDDISLTNSTVITLLLVGLVCLLSSVIATTGIIVAVQYPQAACLCWVTPYSDLAGANGHCCSLYRCNMGMLLLWVMLLIMMSITRNFLRTIVCVGFVIVHMVATYLLRRAFLENGFPVWASRNSSILPDENHMERGTIIPAPMLASLVGGHGTVAVIPHASALSSRNGGGSEGNGVTVGMPIYSVPLCRAEVFAPPVKGGPVMPLDSADDIDASNSGGMATDLKPPPQAPSDDCQCHTCLTFKWLQCVEAEGGMGALNPAWAPGGSDSSQASLAVPPTPGSTALPPAAPLPAPAVAAAVTAAAWPSPSSAVALRGERQATLVAALPRFPAAAMPRPALRGRGLAAAPTAAAAPVLAHPLPEPLLVVDGTPVGGAEGGMPAQLRAPSLPTAPCDSAEPGQGVVTASPRAARGEPAGADAASEQLAVVVVTAGPTQQQAPVSSSAASVVLGGRSVSLEASPEGRLSAEMELVAVAAAGAAGSAAAVVTWAPVSQMAPPVASGLWDAQGMVNTQQGSGLWAQMIGRWAQMMRVRHHS